jgi:kynurenine 3-monooxygenase
VKQGKIILIGSGLAGSLLAIYLAKRGFPVEVYESRGDMRRERTVAGRSINLALSDRGIVALREVGMDEYMLAEAVPMYGRMIHSPDGATKLLPYSGREGEYINSVSRAGLNIALISEAEKYDGVKFHFHRRCVGFDIESGEAIFEDGSRVSGDTVIATDGAGSAVRKSMEASVAGFESSERFLEHGYKELHIPPGKGGKFLLEANALHIWPRHQLMMIALPNFDGSFTCTLFLAKGRSAGAFDTLPNGRVSALAAEPTFDQLVREADVVEFFEQEFTDAVPLMPTLVEDFFSNPTGHLGTVKCWPWNVGGKALLLGDAAHAMVPFYGQGMNCAFEDVRVLAGLIDNQLSTAEAQRRGENTIYWNAAFDEYCALRNPNTDAIQDMAEENFYEMRDATADPVFQRKRALETRLEQTYPDYFSKYSMVTFREDLPYSVAKDRGNAQDRLLMKICAESENIDSLDLVEVIREVGEL